MPQGKKVERTWGETHSAALACPQGPSHHLWSTHREVETSQEPEGQQGLSISLSQMSLLSEDRRKSPCPAQTTRPLSHCYLLTAPTRIDGDSESRWGPGLSCVTPCPVCGLCTPSAQTLDSSRPTQDPRRQLYPQDCGHILSQAKAGAALSRQHHCHVVELLLCPQHLTEAAGDPLGCPRGRDRSRPPSGHTQVHRVDGEGAWDLPGTQGAGRPSPGREGEGPVGMWRGGGGACIPRTKARRTRGTLAPRTGPTSGAGPHLTLGYAPGVAACVRMEAKTDSQGPGRALRPGRLRPPRSRCRASVSPSVPWGQAGLRTAPGRAHSFAECQLSLSASLSTI